MATLNCASVTTWVTLRDKPRQAPDRQGGVVIVTASPGFQGRGKQLTKGLHAASLSGRREIGSVFRQRGDQVISQIHHQSGAVDRCPLRSARRATIQHNLLRGDVGRCARRQKEHCVGNFIRLTKAVQRNLLLEFCFERMHCVL